MDETTFRNHVVTACKLYYDHLVYLDKQRIEQGKAAGKAVAHVQSFHHLPNSKEIFRCDLVEPLKQADSCEVFVCGRPTKHISILKYVRTKKEAFVILRVEKNPEIFSRLDAKDITIESDLKFLISRLMNFYIEKPLCFFHSAPLYLEPHSYPVKMLPSQQQTKAIDLALSKPVSYIWGPPGTGKTQVVLAECLLRYIHAGKRVFLLAPTNNAIEQMLRGILPVLCEAGIDLHCVYRLGMATADFATEFPEVVGCSELEAMQDFLTEKKNALQKELSDIFAYHNTVDNNRKLLQKLQQLRRTITAFYELQMQFEAKESEITHAKESLTSVWQKIIEQQKKLSQLEREQTQCSDQLEILQRSTKKLFYRFRKSTFREQQQRQITQLILLQRDYHVQHDEMRSSLLALYNDKQRLEEVLAVLVSDEDDIAGQQNALVNPVLETSALPEDIVDLFRCLYVLDHQTAINKFEDLFCAIVEDQKAFEGTTPRSPDLVKAELQEIEAQLTSNLDNAKLSQRKNALVLAATVHSALKWLPPLEGEEISHVFCDEAGYTSLAYGMIAFACGCPVTFLGDHLQLSPICEMKNIDLEKKEVCLFALPCAYFSELCEFSMSELHKLYWDTSVRRPALNIPPNFSMLDMHILDYSFRFDDTLASFLSKHIYPMRFYGDASSRFQIILVNAPNPSRKAWNNHSAPEVGAIKEYLKVSSDCISDRSLSIMTPYNEQVKKLKQELSQYKENISTIHKAQGMEFDTVILSVVDKADPFFANSEIPQGKSALNTAISRARQRLVLVCDVDFWKNQHGQLICDLIKLATTPQATASLPPSPPLYSLPT